jgi:aspartyl-tRNA(Asn)/glutamyl-tRNA(Gln) amidotransferase subunit A
MLSSGLSSFHRLARNPWNVARNPGGSSAGAAAAAAAGYGPLHVGTDIGGSIRLPAGWCGLIGLKPSGGRIPIDPSYYGRVAGPLTRTVEDAALMMATLTKPDARDYSSLPPQALDWRVKPLDWRGRKVGLLVDAGCGDNPTPSVRREIERAARDIAAAGAIVEPLAPFLTQEMLDGLDRFWRMRSLIDLNALSAAKRAKVLPFIRAWAEAAIGLDGETLFRGFNQMREMAKAAVAATLRYDFVISPTSPDVTYPAEWAMPSNDPDNAMAHIGFTVAYNMSEQPAATVNCGYDDDGLPIGLQIAGRRFDDLGVLSAAMAFETMRAGEARPWPEPPDQS